MVPRRAAIQLYSHARVFCCPSIYEPFGIFNLEARLGVVPQLRGKVEVPGSDRDLHRIFLHG